MSRTDHDRIYSTPGLPRFEIHELDDRLLAGRNPLSAIDAQGLVDVGVTHVVDLRERHEWETPGRFGRAALAFDTLVVALSRLWTLLYGMSGRRRADSGARRWRSTPWLLLSAASGPSVLLAA